MNGQQLFKLVRNDKIQYTRLPTSIFCHYIYSTRILSMYFHYYILLMIYYIFILLPNHVSIWSYCIIVILNEKILKLCLYRWYYQNNDFHFFILYLLQITLFCMCYWINLDKLVPLIYFSLRYIFPKGNEGL